MNNTQAISTCILLATYNSETHLTAQLDSILQSSVLPDALIVSDDGSTDATMQVLESFQMEFSRKGISLYVHTNCVRDQGVNGNFANLLRLAIEHPAELYFLCDHDDLWFSEKISKSIAGVKDAGGLKNPFSKEGRHLLFTDLEVIDQTGSPICHSFALFQGLPDPATQPLERLLHQNVVTGCTTCFTRSLLLASTPLPTEAIMHDHWLALCATIFGVKTYINESMVGYRQHTHNVVGARKKPREGIAALGDVVFWKAVTIFPWHFAQSIEQAKALLARIELSRVAVAEADVKTIKAFVMLKEARLGERVRQGLQWVSMGNGILERLYLIVVFAALPYLSVRKDEDAI